LVFGVSRAASSPAAQVRVVRVGNPASVRADLRQFTLQACAANHPLGKAAAELRSQVQDMQKRASGDGGSVRCPLAWPAQCIRRP